MISKTMRCSDLLFLAAAVGWTIAGSSRAQPAVANSSDDSAERIIPPSAPPEDSENDWSQLDVDGFALMKEAQGRHPRPPSQTTPGVGHTWTSHESPDGSEILTARRSVSPLWNMQVGTELIVMRQPPPPPAWDQAADRLALNGPSPQSSAQAWAAVTAPGVGAIWDKTAIEARIDPARDQTKLDTSLSKSLPLGEGGYALTLRNGYNLVQHSALPIFGLRGDPVRSYTTDQSARLSVADTGASLVAGQSWSSTDDKWLHNIGAEQKLFGGVSVTGSISQTPVGPLDASLTAAFKRNW
jgi:hypothetical protein